MSDDGASTSPRGGDISNINEQHKDRDECTRSCPKNYSALIYYQGAVSIRKTVLPGMAIPMLKIRRPNGRLIFNMEIAIRR